MIADLKDEPREEAPRLETSLDASRSHKGTCVDCSVVADDLNRAMTLFYQVTLSLASVLKSYTG